MRELTPILRELTPILRMPLRAYIAALVGIALLGSLIYANTLQVPFYFDDQGSIVQNPHIRIDSLRGTALLDAATGGPTPERVVANLSFALNYYLQGHAVSGYHLVNIAIHLLNACLVFVFGLLTLGLASRLPGQAGKAASPGAQFAIALLAALIFVAHPIQIQSVTYIVQRMTSLATLFYLATLIGYILGRQQQNGWKRAGLWLAALLSWLLALGSKEIAALLPLTILLYEWYFFQDLKMGHKWRGLALLALGLLLLAGLTFLWLGADPLAYIRAGYAHRDFTLGQRLLTEPRVVVTYIGLLLLPLPSHLSLLHEIPVSQSLIDPVTTLMSILLLLIPGGVAVVTAPRYRLLSFCILWFFLHLLIESSFIGLELAYEHRLYLPSVGFSLLIAWVICIPRSVSPLIKGAMAAVLVASLALFSWQRNRTWQDPVSLWSDVLAKYPTSYRAHVNLANALAAKGQLEEALAHNQQALRLHPEDSLVYMNLGMTLVQMNQPERALKYLSIAARNARALPEAQLAYAIALQQAGRPREALVYYRDALRLAPDDARVLNGIGETLLLVGRPDLARRYLEQATKAEPVHDRVRRNPTPASATPHGNPR